MSMHCRLPGVKLEARSLQVAEQEFLKRSRRFVTHHLSITIVGIDARYKLTCVV